MNHSPNSLLLWVLNATLDLAALGVGWCGRLLGL